MPWTIYDALGRQLFVGEEGPAGPPGGLTNPMTENLDMDQYQILNHVLHKASSIVGGVEGQIFYDTDDDHVWVGTE